MKLYSFIIWDKDIGHLLGHVRNFTFNQEQYGHYQDFLEQIYLMLPGINFK